MEPPAVCKNTPDPITSTSYTSQLQKALHPRKDEALKTLKTFLKNILQIPHELSLQDQSKYKTSRVSKKVCSVKGKVTC